MIKIIGWVTNEANNILSIKIFAMALVGLRVINSYFAALIGLEKEFKYVEIVLLGLLLCSVFLFCINEYKDLCNLIERMHKVFEILRTLVFVGAAFYIAGWAWGFITKGEAKMDDLKKQGIGLLVGFTILFIIGIILSGILSAADPNGVLGCKEVIRSW